MALLVPKSGSMKSEFSSPSPTIQFKVTMPCKLLGWLFLRHPLFKELPTDLKKHIFKLLTLRNLELVLPKQPTTFPLKALLTSIIIYGDRRSLPFSISHLPEAGLSQTPELQTISSILSRVSSSNVDDDHIIIRCANNSNIVLSSSNGHVVPLGSTPSLQELIWAYQKLLPKWAKEKKQGIPFSMSVKRVQRGMSNKKQDFFEMHLIWWESL